MLQNQSAQTSEPNQSSEQDKLTGTIKFTIAPDGQIDYSEYDSGNTEFSNLPLLFAFALTKSQKANASACWSDYHTDLKGLKLLEDKSSAAMECIADTLASLGMALAYLDKDVGNRHIRNLYWLIAGLGDLLTLTSRENTDITHALDVLSKQNAHGKGNIKN